MNYKDYAMQEFRAAGWVSDEGKWINEMQELICKQVLELLEIFSKHGHSGTSAPYATNLFKELALFKPLVPLTGEDWEWVEVGEKEWQNKRCFHVFKGADGRAYDNDGKIFREPDGVCYITGKSRVYITFPYIPKSEYVDVEKQKE